jgi:hypothetical protein
MLHFDRNNSIKTGFKLRTSMCKDIDDNTVGKNVVVTDIWTQHFSLELSNREAEVNEEMVYKGAEHILKHQQKNKFLSL